MQATNLGGMRRRAGALPEFSKCVVFAAARCPTAKELKPIREVERGVEEGEFPQGNRPLPGRSEEAVSARGIEAASIRGWPGSFPRPADWPR